MKRHETREFSIFLHSLKTDLNYSDPKSFQNFISKKVITR